MAKTLYNLILLVAICLGSSLWAKETPQHEVKADTLRYLQDMRVENGKRLREIDETLSRKFEESKGINLERDVLTLRTARHEHSMRQEFLDRLIFQVDTKFSGGDLRLFLERALTEMAKIDAVSSATDTGLWKFFKFSADAIHSLPERKENILSFLEGYMNRSVANPIRPEDYLNSRNYTNGSKSESGDPLSRDEVGAVADRRIQEMNQKAEQSAKEVQTQ